LPAHAPGTQLSHPERGINIYSSNPRARFPVRSRCLSSKSRKFRQRSARNDSLRAPVTCAYAILEFCNGETDSPPPPRFFAGRSRLLGCLDMDGHFVPSFFFSPRLSSILGIFVTVPPNSHCLLPVADQPLLVEIARARATPAYKTVITRLASGRSHVKHAVEFCSTSIPHSVNLTRHMHLKHISICFSYRVEAQAHVKTQ